jgi:hypothetical protein
LCTLVQNLPIGHSIDLSLLPDINTNAAQGNNNNNNNININDDNEKNNDQNNTNNQTERKEDTLPDEQSKYEPFYDDEASEEEDEDKDKGQNVNERENTNKQTTQQSTINQLSSSTINEMAPFIPLTAIEGDPAYTKTTQTNNTNSTTNNKNIKDQKENDLNKGKKQNEELLKGNPFLEGAIVRAIFKHAIRGRFLILQIHPNIKSNTIDCMLFSDSHYVISLSLVRSFQSTPKTLNSVTDLFRFCDTLVTRHIFKTIFIIVC